MHKKKNMIALRLLPMLTRRIRFPGRERILRKFFPPESFRRAQAPPLVLNTYDGDLKILCDLGSFVEWSVFFKGYFATDFSLVLKRLLRPGDFAVDVGANIGVFTLLMAKGVGARGKVIAYEPNPELYPSLRRNIALNAFQERVEVEIAALADRPGQADLYVPAPELPNRGISSLQPNGILLTGRITSELRTLDDESRRKAWQRLDVLKIDTEGWDTRVILGGVKTIEQHLPAIFFEVKYATGEGANDLLSEACGILRRLGYAPHAIAYRGRLHGFSWRAKLPEGNIVCVHPVRRRRSVTD